MNSESVFRYSYSAKQNEEVQAIRDKYLPREETKLEELKTDDSVTEENTMVADTEETVAKKPKLFRQILRINISQTFPKIFKNKTMLK